MSYSPNRIYFSKPQPLRVESKDFKLFFFFIPKLSNYQAFMLVASPLINMTKAMDQMSVLPTSNLLDCRRTVTIKRLK